MSGNTYKRASRNAGKRSGVMTWVWNSEKIYPRPVAEGIPDLKSTALMKLTYLEMFGHDMSWASFNVLEVMSSQKYRHKRTGYLAAVQSFRRDTEVLMLAENQLKKVCEAGFECGIAADMG
jgi:AP-3 complex subunit delta-1